MVATSLGAAILAVVLDDGQFSPNAAFRYPTWWLVSGVDGLMAIKR